MKDIIVPGVLSVLLLFGIAWARESLVGGSRTALGGTGCSSEVRNDWTLQDAERSGSASPKEAIDSELAQVRRRVTESLARGSVSDIVARQVAQEQAELLALAAVEPVQEESQASVAGVAGRSVWRTPDDLDLWGEVHLIQIEGTDTWVVDRAGWSVDAAVCAEVREAQATFRPSADG